ncbi:MAG: TonB-dependent receptor, partial [Alistipes sp.]|nr:TonB-dependent receptor [Alistipes sp.]
FVEDGSYLRLKDVTLAYTLKPKKIFKTLRLSFTATNLLTWSKYTGYDPEVNTSSSPFVMGVDKGAYPKARSYNFGIEATF